MESADDRAPSSGANDRRGTAEIRLDEPVLLGDVEEDVANLSMSDSWFKEWQAFLGRMEPGDELWDCDYWYPASHDQEDTLRGYAIVRDEQIVAYIGQPLWDYHCGWF